MNIQLSVWIDTIVGQILFDFEFPKISITNEFLLRMNITIPIKVNLDKQSWSW